MVLSMPATTPVNHTHHLPPPTWCCPCQPQHQSIKHAHTIYHHQHGAVHASHNTSQSHTHSPSTTTHMVLSMPASTPVNHTHHLPPSTWCCPCQPQHQSITHTLTIYHHQHGAVHASLNTSQSNTPSTTINMVLSMPASTPVNQTHTHHLPPSTWCCPCQPQHQSITHTIYHHQHGAVHASLNTSQSNTHTPSTTTHMVLSMPASTPVNQTHTHTIYHHQHGAVHASLNTSQSHTPSTTINMVLSMPASTPVNHTHTPSTTINMVLSMPASTPVNHTHHLPPSTWCCPCQPQHQSIKHTIYHHQHGAVHASHNTSQSNTHTPSTTINMVLSMPATTPVNHTHHLPPSTWCCPCQPQHQSIKHTHTIYHHQHGAVHASHNTSQSNTHSPSTTINMVLSMPASTPVNQTHTHHLPPSTWCCPCQPQHQSITHTIYHHQHGAVHASHNTSQSNTHTPSTTINMVLSMPATTPVNQTHTHHLPPSTWCCPCQPQHQSIKHTIYHHQHGAVHASLNTSQSHTHSPSTTINMVLSMPATTPVNHTHHLPPSTWCCPCQPQHQSITHTHHLPPPTWCCPCQPQHQSITHTLTIYHHQHGAVHASLNTSQSHTHTPSTTINMVLSMPASTPVNHTHHLPPSTWCCPCQPQHQSITRTIYHHQHGAVHASHNTSQSHTHTPSTTINMVLSIPASTPVNHTHHLPPSTWCCPCQPQHQSITHTHTIYHHQHGAVHASLNTSQSHTHTPSTTINMVLSMPATTPVNHTHHLPPPT